ncbi:MAG: hypothetical protein GEV04_09330 [Actinophytocola sp.]|nr:hypothetical protein [Actinophytocola sp.]
MRTTVIAAGSLALALTLGACGGESTGGTATAGKTFTDAASLVSAAKESTSEKKSANFTMDMDMGPVTATADGQGLFDGENSQMAMTMSMDMSAAGMGTMNMEIRMLDNVMYVKLPSGMPGANPAKPWTKMDLADMSAAGGMDMGQLMEQNDPTKALEMLKGSGEITGTEETQVNGEPATKYTVNVDFAKLMSQYGGGMGQLGDMRGLKIDTIPVEAWINAENLPVRFKMDMSEIMNQAAKSSGQMPKGVNFDGAHITMTYSDWGTPVSIEAPPASQIGKSGLPGGN